MKTFILDIAPTVTIRSLAVFGGLLCGVGVYGLFYVASGGTSVSIRLEPEVAAFGEDALEYTLVKVPFQLRNLSGSAVTLIAARGSCGCMELRTSGGRALEPPISIGARDSLPLEVVVGTGSRSGPQEFKVWTRCQGPSVTLDNTSTVKLVVRAGQRVEPNQVLFPDNLPDSNMVADLLVGDGFPEPGILIESIAVSHPQRMSVELVSLSGNDREAAVAKMSNSLVPRYRIRVVLNRSAIDDGDFNGAVIVNPAARDQPRLSVPVVAIGKKALLELSPHRLIINESDLRGNVVRSVRCIIRKGEPKLAISECPTFVRGEIAASDDGTRYLTMSIDGPELRKAGDATVQITSAGDPDESARLNIVAVSDLDE
ncbi:MAG TPA: hypothetical protein VHY91_12390 [Pirellulales bacterium]|jgi:hypothetical protein|nr:hypothetical protein [Pirellulales bacterium]